MPARGLTVWRRLRCSIGAGNPLDPNVETLGAMACRQHCARPPGAESLKCRQFAPLVALVREQRPLTAQAGGASHQWPSDVRIELVLRRMLPAGETEPPP